MLLHWSRVPWTSPPSLCVARCRCCTVVLRRFGRDSTGDSVGRICYNMLTTLFTRCRQGSVVPTPQELNNSAAHFKTHILMLFPTLASPPFTCPNNRINLGRIVAYCRLNSERKWLEQCVILGGRDRDRIAEMLSVGRQRVDALETRDERLFGMFDTRNMLAVEPQRALPGRLPHQRAFSDLGDSHWMCKHSLNATFGCRTPIAHLRMQRKTLDALKQQLLESVSTSTNILKNAYWTYNLKYVQF